MTFAQPPVVGHWYRRADRPQPFHVVATNAADRTVDVEYFDGTVDEWPLTHWHCLDIEETGAPPDPSGALDDATEP